MINLIKLYDLFIHLEWLIRILVATLCGCLIGYERTSRNKEAGLRTHAIIALGASLIMIVSKYGFVDTQIGDGGRLAAQVVSGIGFLGAGVIFVPNGTISGLTTAAGMWITSGIGLCIGAGLYDLGIMTTLLIVSLQTLFHKRFITRLKYITMNVIIELEYEPDALKKIYNIFTIHKVDINDMRVQKLKNETMHLEVEITTFKDFNKTSLVNEMLEQPYIKKFYYK